MKRYLLILAAALPLAGCPKKPTCNDADHFAEVAAPTIAAALGCKNVDRMIKDFSAEIERAGLCNETLPTGPVAGMVCPVMVDLTVKYLASKLPWDCSGGEASAASKARLTELCMTAPW